MNPRTIRIAASLIAALLVAGSLRLPLWRMELKAPQYPNGLHITAYGNRLEGDLREINIVNHYIGMKEIPSDPVPEMALFPWSVALLTTLILLAALSKKLARIAALAAIAVPIGILSDVQWWLYRYGTDRNPDAPLRLPEVTPWVIGISRIGNFTTSAALSSGLMVILAAALIILMGDWWAGRLPRRQTIRLAPVTLMLAMVWSPLSAQTLQQRIDQTPAGGTLVVRGGAHAGPITIARPIRLMGVGGPVIDGGGRGSVVTIAANDVLFRGFVVRNSGRTVTEEAAGVKAQGSRNRIEENVIRDVHFGIQALQGERNTIRGNVIRPGRGSGYRAGDGINLWYVNDSEVMENRVDQARDGIYLSFTSGVRVRGNRITGSRYGIHSMFSQQIVVEENHIRDNLLGAALMNSDRLLFRRNRVERHRTGSTAYGVLLKDIGDLVLEDNELLGNRVGLYADSAPDRPERSALIRRNRLIGNIAAFALSNVRLTVTENAILDNLTEIRAAGSHGSDSNQWSRNYWGAYRGYDRDGDGVGEVPFRVEAGIDALLQRNPLTQAFLYTPAHAALEIAARMFPLFRPRPLAVDPTPLTRPPRGAAGGDA